MKNLIFVITAIIFIQLNLSAEEYILIKGKAKSFKDFDKFYIKVNKKIKGKHVIKNNRYKFKTFNSFSFLLPDPYEKDQEWLKIIDAINFDNISTGKNVVIGVLDSGVELNHEDLKGQIIDYFNVADNNTDVRDFIGHGTSVIGIMGAIAHNGNGIIGLSPDAKFIVAKIAHNGDFTFDDYSVAKGIYYLVDKGCKIINMSIQMTNNSEIVDDAIEYAKSKGVILVASTGNGGNNEQSYPAKNPYVLGVGSTDENYNIASFSNYDKNTFIFAPGQSILTTYINNSYTHQTGTSFSAPMLTSLIADLLSLNPYYSLNDIIKIIKESTEIFTSNNKFQVIDVINSLKSTAVKFKANRVLYTIGDNLTMDVILPPMSNNFNLYLGIITPSNLIMLLQIKNNNFYWEYNKIFPTCSNIVLNDFINFTLFGDKGIFPSVKISKDIPSGIYKFCGIYEKEGKFLGYFKCKDIIILK